jgi:hypothetical protein
MGALLTREEHIESAKARALEYVDAGELQNALASISSDLSQHEETRDHPAIAIGLALLTAGHLNTQAKMRMFILGFR